MIIEQTRFALNNRFNPNFKQTAFDTRSFSQSEELSMPHEHSISLSESSYRKKTFIKMSKDPKLTLPDADIDRYHDLILTKQHTNRLFKPTIQNDSVVRSELFNFAWALCKQLQYSLHTYYLALSYIDVVLYSYSIKESQLKICSFSCVILAAKLEENIDKIPSMNDSIAFFNKEFDDQTFMHYEKVVLDCLHWSTNIKTSFVFLKLFLAKGVISEEEVTERVDSAHIDDFLNGFEQIAAFFLHLTVQNYSFNQYTCNVVATASVVITRCCLNLDIWNDDLSKQLKTEWTEVEKCLYELIDIVKKSNSEIYIRFSEQLDQLIYDMTCQNIENKEMDQNDADLQASFSGLDLKENQRNSDTSKETPTKSKTSKPKPKDEEKKSDQMHIKFENCRQFERTFFEDSFEETGNQILKEDLFDMKNRETGERRVRRYSMSN